MVFFKLFLQLLSLQHSLHSGIHLEECALKYIKAFKYEYTFQSYK